MKQNRTFIFIMLLLTMLSLAACSSKSDPELNDKFSPLSSEKIYSYSESTYYDYYDEKFKNLSIDTVSLDMGLDWFVRKYDEVYTGKADYFYIYAFDTPNDSTYDLVKMYNDSPDSLYYLKPYIDCYLLMNEDKMPSEEELENIKVTILYALEYYINGKDFADIEAIVKMINSDIISYEKQVDVCDEYLQKDPDYAYEAYHEGTEYLFDMIDLLREYPTFNNIALVNDLDGFYSAVEGTDSSIKDLMMGLASNVGGEELDVLKTNAKNYLGEMSDYLNEIKEKSEKISDSMK